MTTENSKTNLGTTTLQNYLREQIASCVLRHKKCFLCRKTNLPPTRSRGWFASKVGKRIEVKNQGYGK